LIAKALITSFQANTATADALFAVSFIFSRLIERNLRFPAKDKRAQIRSSLDFADNKAAI
jgi:hypothetical protein